MTPTVRPRKRKSGPIQSASRWARYSFTVTTCTPSPVRAFRYAGSVATSVLPSPVRISAILPWCRVMPPMSCTSKWRIFSDAPAGLADDREGFGKHGVEGLAALQAVFESAVLARRASSLRAWSGGFESLRGAYVGGERADDPVVTAAEEAREKLQHRGGFQFEENYSLDGQLRDRKRLGGRVLYAIDVNARYWFAPANIKMPGARSGARRFGVVARVGCGGRPTPQPSADPIHDRVRVTLGAEERGGLIWRPFFNTSKCTWGPVERPVEPIRAMASPGSRSGLPPPARAGCGHIV